MKVRWKHGVLTALIVIAAIAAVGIGLFESGVAERWMRYKLIGEIQQRTGMRAQIQGFHFNLWRLQAEIDGLTLHGLEPPGSAPLFHADRIDFDVRVISFLHHEIALNQLIVDRPDVAVRIGADGRSNIPSPRTRIANRPWRQTLFQLRIGQLALRDGSIAFNNRRTPLSVNGRTFQFDLHYSAPANAPDFYIGRVDWQGVQLERSPWREFTSNVSAKFTLYRDSFDLDEFVWKLPHSEIRLRADLASFARPQWKVRYRGNLSLADLRNIFRKKDIPDGAVEFSGQAQYVTAAEPVQSPAGSKEGAATRAGARKSPVAHSGEWTANGYYKAQKIRLPYEWFHADGIATWGNFQVAQRHLEVPNLHVDALGGAATGRLDMNFDGFRFRAETHMRGADLARIFAALDHPGFPVDALHWDGLLDVDSVNTWNLGFRDFRSTGETQWSPPAILTAGKIPVTARIGYDYSDRLHQVAISQGEIDTPKSRVRMDGPISSKHSNLNVQFQTSDLLDWDDFINILRGEHATPEKIAGDASWQGTIVGPITAPTFSGRVSATDASYGKLYWDRVDGDMEYSPDEFRMTDTVVRRGRSQAKFNLYLGLDGTWGFPPSSTWILDARMQHSPSDDLQSIFDTSYPIRGYLSGDFHGRGTRAFPEFDADFTYDDIETKGFHFDSLSGRLHAEHDELQLTNATLRKAGGDITGNFEYHFEEGQAILDLTGEGIPLESFRKLQTSALPISGRLSFRLRGSGPLRALVAQGDLHVASLKLGVESEGNYSGRLDSDGRRAHLTLASQPAPEKLQGELTVGFSGDRPISGRLSVKDFDLDPFISSGLHLKQLTGHGSADGTFALSGNLRQPNSIQIQADIARITFNYELVKLTNDQDIRLTYQRNEVRVEQAHLHGPNTDFRLSGFARFDRDRPLNFTVLGGVNLRLVKGLLPALDAQGRADLNVSIHGTISRPEVIGQASVRSASANYADFPVGLSDVNGNLVFNRSQLLFDRVTAEAGGGKLSLSGSVTYGEGPLRYEVTATTSTVRIRYPEGMSWLAGGTLRFSGTTSAALLSGRVQVNRLLFAPGVDITSFFSATAFQASAGAPNTSTFLQNLAFDVEGQTSPGARIEWTGAHISVDGNVRLRGTWDRPVLLGHVHLLSGEMPFRGNTFQLTRGDINFANPFRLDPVLDVELTSRISQYQVTVDFSGPADRLTMNYRSDPPLSDSDIVALLALGSPGEASALRSQPGASQNYGATALLSEAITSGIGGRIEHLFGISQFRVDPFAAGNTTESNAAARVTIVEQVARGLTITYSTNATTTNQYQLIQVQYAVKRNVSVEFLRDINGTYGFDIKWVRHFK
ncbi:MAG: translocation/assembly module TamB domain-containing protein [Candidatus Acidiferrales bacterium]